VKPLNPFFKKSILILALGLFIFFVVMSLDAYRQIRKIGIGSPWGLPSRIYSAQTIISPGDDIELSGLIQRLKRLRYRQVDEVICPGEYSMDEQILTVFIHPFNYPQERSEELIASILLDGNTVQGITEPSTGKKLDHIVIEPECISEIFDSGREDRAPVALEDCPGFLIDAIISTEDRRFYSHSGIDLRSVIRAALINLKNGRIVEGASTITQQLIKNLFLSKKRTFSRKIKEVWMALILEMVYSKQEILHLYINEIYLGQHGHAGIHGVGRAARLFFDKDISDIDISEAALLSGIIRAPNRYSPYTNPNMAVARRNTVLEIMLSEDKIDNDVYLAAKDIPISLIPRQRQNRLAPYFIDYVLDDIKDQYPLSLLSKGGYSIYTTLDMHMQTTAQAMLTHTLKGKDKCITGAVIVCDPASGDILAMVGGKDYSTSQYNRSTRIKRHIGSLIKPFIYYTALRRGYNLSSFIDDSPVSVTLTDGNIWEPDNFDNQSHGRVMLIDALIHSYNRATVRLGMDIGLTDIIGEISKVIPGQAINENPSLILGALDCSVLEAAMLYCPLANRGRPVDPRSIKCIANENHTMIQDYEYSNHMIALDPSVVYILNHALEEVVRSGTAKTSSMYGIPEWTCGKTGTTDDMRDSWFVGFTPDILVAAWLGNDNFEPIGLTGASGAMPIASMILSKVAAPCERPLPADIVMCSVDPDNGKLRRWRTKDSIRLPYIKGTEPTEVSDRDEPGFIRFFKSLFK